MQKLLFILLFSIFSISNLEGQDPHRFDNEIYSISHLSKPTTENLIVFTGSSSIRKWENLSNDCSDVKLINTGFGGSHMSDLLYFLDETVLQFQATQVYIYEGDNDISAEKNPKDIIETTKQVVNKILKSNPEIKIHFISAKPSPSRWSFKDQYLAFNSLLKDYCDSHKQLSYIDVWNPMIDKNGLPKSSIFISDSLHMNHKGYQLWKNVICIKSE